VRNEYRESMVALAVGCSVGSSAQCRMICFPAADFSVVLTASWKACMTALVRDGLVPELGFMCDHNLAQAVCAGVCGGVVRFRLLRIWLVCGPVSAWAVGWCRAWMTEPCVSSAVHPGSSSKSSRSWCVRR